jgi:alpha-D-ribose 1-methylphosphonate 5-triphosphate diphosphatase
MRGLAIVNADLLLPDGIAADSTVICEDGMIAAVGGAAGDREVLDAGGRLLAPGIIDLHGDAFERQVMPRPGTFFPLDMALMETDRQLAANGITTAFHGLTLSWEPGLRSLASGEAFVDALRRMLPHLAVDNRLHLRWETFAFDAIDRVCEWLADEHKPVLAFNDHTTSMLRKMREPSKMQVMAQRSGLELEAFRALIEAAYARREEVPAAVAHVAAAARAAGVAMLSHDDYTPQMRRGYRELGCHVAEFPMTPPTVAEARGAGEHVVLGAPNVVRGGSHIGAINAADAVEAGDCTVLASDYYYPTLLAAVFRLHRERGLPLHQVWPLVGASPAAAAGMPDRGTIAAGQRADLVLVASPEGAPPAVAATLVAGRIVYRARH